MPRIFFGLLFLLALQTPAMAVDPNPELKERFLRAYEPQAARLVTFYENVRLRARYTDTIRGEPPQTYEQLYLANGRLIRLDEIGLGARNSFGRIANPDRGCFRVYHRPGDAFQLIRSVGPDDFPATLEAARQDALLPCSAYCFFGLEIVDFIRLSNLHVTEMATFSSKGPEPLVRVSYERVWSNRPRFPKTTGWFLFAEGQCWAVREASAGAPDWPDDVRWRVDYSGTKDGVPLVHGIERWGTNQHGQRVRTRIGEVTELIPGPPPLEEFALSVYGISDAGLGPTAPSWFYLQLAAVVALATAVLFWQLARRRRSRRMASGSL